MAKKWDDATPGMKMISLFTLLLFSGGKKWSLKKLSEKLNCSKRIVLRLIDQMTLSTSCEIVKTKENRESYYHIEKVKDLPEINFTPVSLDNLLLVRDLVGNLLPSDARNILESTMNQVAAMVSVHGEDKNGYGGSPVGGRISKGRIDYSKCNEQFGALTKAIGLKRVCEITYRNSLTKEAEMFKFAPFELVVLQESIYVRGWMLKVDDKYPSTLSLHRIREVSVTDDCFMDLHLTDPYEKNERFGIIEDESFEARIYFDSDAALYVSERIWSNGQTVRVTDDGGIELTIMANNKYELISWILSFGGSAKALSPDWLKDEIVEMINLMKEKYTS
jgi:predicted DNA-binding transcriptional regulator YafY